MMKVKEQKVKGENIKGQVYLLFAFALAGTSVVTARFVSDKLGSFTITTVSLGLLLLCLSPFYVSQTIKTIRYLKGSDWKMILLQAAFGIFAFRTFLLLGLKFTSTPEAGILTGATPAITALLAYIFLKEPLIKKTVFGIGCTVGGILLLQGMIVIGSSFSIHHIGGNLLILCAAASESIFNVLSRRYGVKGSPSQLHVLHPMVQTLLVSSVAFILCLIPALLEQPAVSLKAIGILEWIALAWYGLVVTALAFAFFYAGIKRCDAYTTAAFSGLIPLTSMLLSVVLLGERIAFIQWVGGILVIFGILLIGANSKVIDAGCPKDALGSHNYSMYEQKQVN